MLPVGDKKRTLPAPRSTRSSVTFGVVAVASVPGALAAEELAAVTEPAGPADVPGLAMTVSVIVDACPVTDGG